MENKVLLEVKNLKKYFNTPKGLLHAVDDINFTICEGKNTWSGWRIRMWKIYNWKSNFKTS